MILLPRWSSSRGRERHVGHLVVVFLHRHGMWPVAGFVVGRAHVVAVNAVTVGPFRQVGEEYLADRAVREAEHLGANLFELGREIETGKFLMLAEVLRPLSRAGHGPELAHALAHGRGVHEDVELADTVEAGGRQVGRAGQSDSDQRTSSCLSMQRVENAYRYWGSFSQ